MSKTAIYTANTSSQNVVANGIINPGTVVRRFGQGLNLSGNAIQVSCPGYYDCDISVTLAPTAIGNVTVSLYKEGVPIQGMTATESVSTANNPTNLSITGLIRENCGCCDGVSNLTLVLTGTTSAVTNVAMDVHKI